MLNKSVFINQPLERVTEATRVIDTNHAYIHEGKMFNCAFRNILLAGATRKITALTPANKYIHYRPIDIMTSADKVTVNFYENSSGNSGGTSKTIINRNRTSNKVSESVIKDGETVTTNGNLISGVYLPGSTGVGQIRTGNVVTGADEWVLKQNTLYTLEIINGSDSSNDIGVNFHWYEEDNG